MLNADSVIIALTCRDKPVRKMSSNHDIKCSATPTTLLCAVSSKDWMTFNLCLNLICSMTSDRRLPNFYMKKKKADDLPLIM